MAWNANGTWGTPPPTRPWSATGAWNPGPQTATPAPTPGSTGGMAGAFNADPHPAADAARRAATATASGPSYGTESGPGYLEQRYLSRLNGTDAAYNYAVNRGMNDIDSRMAAGGSYNSGARGQQLSDFGANMTAQSQAQLDALAGGASGEHMGRIGQMLGAEMGLAGGLSGLSGTYDTTAANAMSAGNIGAIMAMMNSAGAKAQGEQGLINNLVTMGGLGALYGGGAGGSAAGGGGVLPNGLMAPSF